MTAARNDIVGETLFSLAILAVREFGRDLSLTAGSTLSTLERTGPRRLTDLALSEGVTQPSMTALVTQLENLGLAERRRHSGDGRVVLVAISSGGREYLESRRRAGVSRFSTLIGKLAPHEVDALGTALRPLRQLLHVVEEPGGGAGPAAGRTRAPRPARATSSVAKWR
jgi:DNA-binding MarR family transcriptional regulator